MNIACIVDFGYCPQKELRIGSHTFLRHADVYCQLPQISFTFILIITHSKVRDFFVFNSLRVAKRDLLVIRNCCHCRPFHIAWASLRRDFRIWFKIEQSVLFVNFILVVLVASTNLDDLTETSMNLMTSN